MNYFYHFFRTIPGVLGFKLTLFPVAQREQIIYHVIDNLRLGCVQPPTNFLTNMTIETFHAGHLGRHLATTSIEESHKQVTQDRQTIKLDFPGQLCRAAFAILAMFS